jgi:hypothetical protein
VREVAGPLGLDCEAPAFAFLALVRSAKAPPATPERARVIGDPMPVRSGEAGIYICKEGERRLAPLGAGAIARGDVVRGGEGELKAELLWESPR